MISKSHLLAIALLSLGTIQCSQPRISVEAPPKPAGSKEHLSKVKLTDLDGNPLNLKDFVGKPVFLNFWATWCGPCVSEMASIEKASQQFKDKILFLAASNESPALIKSYVNKNKLSFMFARLEVTYLDAYVLVLPTTFLIDANGELVQQEEGFRNWNSAESTGYLESLLKK
ncbi:MAG: TlpA family protein disulfide reductase [Saprospiraceae bacterium]